MSRPIAISLSPNTEKDDIVLAWKILRSPYLWHDRVAGDEVVKLLQQRLTGAAVLFSSGRAALAAALRAMPLTVGDEVIIQAFTCVAVPAAVKWVGATPVFADINPETYNFDVADVAQKITSRTRAIVIQHTFGIPGPIKEIQALAQQQNIKVIEDCAHALGATVDGRPVGSWGDVAIVSFGRDKIVSSVFGGAVISSQPDIMRRVRTIAAHGQTPPTSWIVSQLLHPIVVNALLPWYGSGLGKAVLVALQKLHVLSRAVEPAEKQGLPPHHIHYAFPPALAHLALHQLRKLDRFTARRREIAGRYATALVGSAAIVPTIPASSSPAWLRFPVRIKEARAIFLKARRQNIVLGDWYRPAIAPCGVASETIGYKPGSCPAAEAAAEEVINLPTYPLLSDTQVQKVIQLFA